MKHEVGWARVNGIVRRRRWPVLLIVLASATVGLIVVKQLPKVYEARAVVRIDDPRPGRDYVNPTVNEPDPERLRSARLGFLAQPIVAEAAAKIGMAASPLELEKITARLDARQEGVDTFVLTFEDRDRERARAFLAALTQAYTQRRSAESSERAAAAAAFLQSQLDAMRPRVADAEGEVEKYRLQHYGSLPDQLEANLRVLDENEMTVHALIASLDATQSRRRDILDDAKSPLRHQEEEVARDLSAARTKYTPTSPEVKALEGELTRVRTERLSDEGEAAKRLQASRELRTADDQIARLGAQIGELRGRGEELRKRIDGAARNGEVLARMALERDVVRDRFRSLVAKHEEALLAAGLEAGLAGRARVAVVEPAWASAQPVKPPKPLFALLALALAAVLGLGVGYFIDTLDRRILATEDVRALTGNLPILAVVPKYSSRAAHAARS